ncbi:response regulator YycF [uncultured Tyzzerella sp.]|uniref:response regulator YycF n=1 Tax=uncultured Tyzzerella sp. TaxID=2321398 RepID=UPI0029433069|nr:response regulator YycF [uncultured Tyzzerella sp.]
MSNKILVVDDEQSIMNIIAFNLKKEGYNVVCAEDGEMAIKVFEEENPDLILLDIMMPKIDGYGVCRRIRDRSDIPIIMLTARADEVDKVLGLEIGADDYVTKPFSNRELMARVKANLRRKISTKQEEQQEDNGNIGVFGEIKINFDRYEVCKRDTPINLTIREFELLKFLVLKKNQIFTREALLSQVWGYEYYGDVRAVDVTIRRLREKIEDDASKPKYIITKRGIGYYFMS